MDAAAAARSTTFSSNVCGARSRAELIYPGDFQSGLDLFPALENYFSLLQPTLCAARHTQALGYQDAGRSVPAPTQKEKGTFAMMGDLCPPNPLGFSALVFQNGCFSLYSKRHLP